MGKCLMESHAILLMRETLGNSKTFYKAIEMKLVWFWCNERQIDGIEFKLVEVRWHLIISRHLAGPLVAGKAGFTLRLFISKSIHGRLWIKNVKTRTIKTSREQMGKSFLKLVTKGRNRKEKTTRVNILKLKISTEGNILYNQNLKTYMCLQHI